MPDVLFTKDFTLIDLQTRISFLEDTCDELSKIIARQDRDLKRFARSVKTDVPTYPSQTRRCRHCYI